MQVWYAVKRLALGFGLIVLASAALLVSDRDRRTTHAAAARVFRVAVVQHASTPVLDEGVQGMIEGLAGAGFRDGERLRIQTYNAQGDLAAGNAIAKQVTIAAAPSEELQGAVQIPPLAGLEKLTHECRSEIALGGDQARRA